MTFKKMPSRFFIFYIFTNFDKNIDFYLNQATDMTGYRSTSSRFLTGVLAVIMPLCVMTGCKPTEKNYRAAYDVARDKREREIRRQEEIRSEMGVGGGVMQEVDGAALADICGRNVWTRHIRFPAKDSVATYSVSVAAFKMKSNAEAMAADMRAKGWSRSRSATGGDEHFVLVFESAEAAEAVTEMERFSSSAKDWQYVGQPGIMMIIGGSR